MPQSIAMTSSQNTSVAADLDGEDKSWQDMANCLGVDPDLFFPERGASTREAKEVCKGCVVRDDCLEYALANGEKFGIWGVASAVSVRWPGLLPPHRLAPPPPDLARSCRTTRANVRWRQTCGD